MRTVYRIQDKDGRGPFKPGFSCRWCDPRNSKNSFPSWIEEFGLTLPAFPKDMHFGCGCLNFDQAQRWFSFKEYSRLTFFKYKFVKMEVDLIIDSSDIQCLFGRKKPLNVDFEVIALY